MDVPVRPAVYASPGQGYSAEGLRGVARDRGWPEPEIYADAAGPAGPGGLVDLIVSVASGRRYELLLAVLDHSDPVLGQLLTDCARLGTAVSLRSEHGPSAVAGGYGWSAIGSEQGPERGEPGSTLELARLEALTSVSRAGRCGEITPGGTRADAGRACRVAATALQRSTSTPAPRPNWPRSCAGSTMLTRTCSPALAAAGGGTPWPRRAKAPWMTFLAVLPLRPRVTYDERMHGSPRFRPDAVGPPATGNQRLLTGPD